MRWYFLVPYDESIPGDGDKDSYSIDLETGNLVAIPKWPSTWGATVPGDLTHDGRFLQFERNSDDEPPEIGLLDAASGQYRLLSTGEPLGASFSPDDCWIVYSEYELESERPDTGIYIMQTLGGSASKIAEGRQPLWLED